MKQGTGFRDRIREFEELGVVIFGVSTDPYEANAAFAEKYEFPFPLLSDLERRVCLDYGACEHESDPHALRVTYVVDPGGRIVEVHTDIDTVSHAAILLSSLAARHGQTRPVKAYVLGRLGVDVAPEARRDSLAQQGLTRPEDPAEVLAFLDRHPTAAAAVTWTLAVDGVPLYALRGAGVFAAEVHAGLRRLLHEQLQGGENERVAVAGKVAGSQRLSTGGSVPVLWTEPRSLRSWSVAAGAGPDEGLPARLDSELRNRGLTPRDRAVNFAASSTEALGPAYRQALTAGLALAGLNARPAPVCRPGSDCWDVELGFFDPTARFARAAEVYRLTVDVSDLVPVILGKVRHWQVDARTG